MTRIDQLAKHIERTVVGPLWHGPVLDDALAGISAEQAAAHPVAGAHSIWEIVLHVAAWAEIARARLDGRSEEHTSELQSHSDLVCRLLLEKKKHNNLKRRHI